MSNEHSVAIATDVRAGLTSQDIRDEIISKVGMMADARTPEMQARYDAAVERETASVLNPIGPRRAPSKPKPDHYKTICISIYNRDLHALNSKVVELKRRGLTKMSKSELIRIAVARLDIDSLLTTATSGDAGAET